MKNDPTKLGNGANLTSDDRAAAFRLLGIQPAAEWCWNNSDLVEALTNGVEVTDSGMRIMGDN